MSDEMNQRIKQRGFPQRACSGEIRGVPLDPSRVGTQKV